MSTQPFTLQNKLSQPYYGELPPDFPFDDLPESGILPVQMTFEERIGTETALWIFDKTPFIDEIAKVRPFQLRLKTGLVPTSHGPIGFLLFYVVDPRSAGSPFVMYDYHLNIYDPASLSPWHDLARQSHWHVLVLNAEGKQVECFEFENNFGLASTLQRMQEVCEREKPGDFQRAKAEFCEDFSLEELYAAS